MEYDDGQSFEFYAREAVRNGIEPVSWIEAVYPDLAENISFKVDERGYLVDATLYLTEDVAPLADLFALCINEWVEIPIVTPKKVIAWKRRFDLVSVKIIAETLKLEWSYELLSDIKIMEAEAAKLFNKALKR